MKLLESNLDSSIHDCKVMISSQFVDKFPEMLILTLSIPPSYTKILYLVSYGVS